MLSKEEIQERVAAVRWYHAFEIVPEVVTPGSVAFDARRLLDSMEIAKDLSGKRALDIGTWDGPMAFELEHRGAEVVALDILDPDETAFNAAKDILSSKVHYVRESVYNLTALFKEKFDLICFLGVFYHLTDPMKAFEEIAKSMTGGGQLLLEGECLRNYAEDLSGKGIQGPWVREIAESEIPLALCCPGEYKGSPNTFIPNLSALNAWLRFAGLELKKYQFDEAAQYRPPHQRIKGVAGKRVRSLEISRVDHAGGKVVVSGRGFSERTVVNLWRIRGAELINFGGITPHGAVKLPIAIDGQNQFHFDLPAGIEPGPLTLELVNPPYLSHFEKVKLIDAIIIQTDTMRS